MPVTVTVTSNIGGGDCLFFTAIQIIKRLKLTEHAKLLPPLPELHEERRESAMVLRLLTRDAFIAALESNTPLREFCDASADLRKEIDDTIEGLPKEGAYGSFYTVFMLLEVLNIGDIVRTHKVSGELHDGHVYEVPLPSVSGIHILSDDEHFVMATEQL